MSALSDNRQHRGRRSVGGGSTKADPGSGPDSAASADLAAARRKLGDQLRVTGRADAAVEAAFRAVPRHTFLPETDPVQAYQDVAVVIKSDAEGLPVSASTQPAMMAVMLSQLGLAAGHRVLEVGTGTGYNAALIAYLTGDQRSVVTIDVLPELIVRARANLSAAGYGRVTVVCGDGAAGVPDHAPYDRIIVTAGAWDLAPQWQAQLSASGRIVLPLSVRGIQLSVALEAAGDHLVSKSACRCGFVSMAGAISGPESFLPLGPQPGLHAQVADGPIPDADELYAALSGPVTEESAGLRAAGIAELADLDLWLTLAEPGLTRVNMMGRHESLASPDQQRIASLMPIGGLARVGGSGGLGLAGFSPAGRAGPAGRFEITARGYGPSGPGLARHLARQAIVWDELGRPGAAELELSAWPKGTPLPASGGAGIVIDRPHNRFAVRWSTS